MNRRGCMLNPLETIATPTTGDMLIGSDSQVEDGELIYVRDQVPHGPVFAYRRNSGLVPDGVDIFKALYGDGVWVRTNIALVDGESGGPVQSHRVAFDTAVPSPVFLGTLGAGNLIGRAVIVIQIAFDDPVSRLQFGTSADVGAFLDIPATYGGQFDSPALTEAVLSDVLILTIDKQSSTQGRGLLFYEVAT